MAHAGSLLASGSSPRLCDWIGPDAPAGLSKKCGSVARVASAAALTCGGMILDLGVSAIGSAGAARDPNLATFEARPIDGRVPSTGLGVRCSLLGVSAPSGSSKDPPL